MRLVDDAQIFMFSIRSAANSGYTKSETLFSVSHAHETADNICQDMRHAVLFLNDFLQIGSTCACATRQEWERQEETAKLVSASSKRIMLKTFCHMLSSTYNSCSEV